MTVPENNRRSDPEAAALPGTLLVMEEARRLIVRQEADIDTLRSRVATLLSAASVVAAAASALLPDDPSQLGQGFQAASVVAFVAVAGLSFFILYPRVWKLGHPLAKTIERLGTDDPPGGEEVAYNFARLFNTAYRANAPQLARLQRGMAAAVYALSCQLTAAALALVFA